MAFQRIRPRKPDPFSRISVRKATAALYLMLLDAQARLQVYPPARTSYRRKGAAGLGGSWNVQPPHPEGADIVGRVGSKKSYAVWVEGPTRGSGRKQRALFRRYGWTSVTTVARDVQRIHRGSIRAALRGT